jgi:alkylation response protein AidB-like acyl-CoA dehydrogenase
MTEHSFAPQPAAPPPPHHYRSNRRDLEFLLFEVLDRGSVLGTEPYADMDVDTARAVLAEVDRLATHELAASLVDSDRNPPVYDPVTATVTVPDSFRASYRAYRDAQWWRLDIPEELGGTPAPPSLRWAAQEMVLGANPAIHMYSCGPAFAGVIHALGTPEQRSLAQAIVDRGWSTSMVLTEPDAGSDVGAGRASATQQPDGTWHIDGVKRFITNGEHDLADNIVHLVLARPVGAGPGTKGLSLFLVPKYHWSADGPERGELGERNGVRATNVEHKMGLRVSATCELTFGADGVPAVGYLLGDTHDGIAQMFRVIEDARMMVGTKAIATLSTAYLGALDYARTRVQGPDLAAMRDKASPRVTITHHPDVRRMLLTMKAYAEGLRALVLYTASVQDDVRLAEHRGEDAAEVDALNDLLLPLVKGYGSERSYELLATAMQTVGGSGYLQDYPFEQYIRDAKIDTLYEGTTGIQGMDLFFRKIVRDEGHALTLLAREILTFAKSGGGDDPFAAEREALAAAVEDVQASVGAMVGWLRASAEDSSRVYRVGENTTRLLLALGDVVVAWLLLRSADVAHTALTDADLTEADRDFYAGKVAAARWFARTVLPTVATTRVLVESTTDDLMELPESAL